MKSDLGPGPTLLDEDENRCLYRQPTPINPVNGKLIPVWIADYVLATYGTGAIMAVPGQDRARLGVCRGLHLPIILRTVQPPAGTSGKVMAGGPSPKTGTAAINSANGSTRPECGLSTPRTKHDRSLWLKRKGVGKRKVNYKLRDWLFSRQRYWGEPFPILHEVDARQAQRAGLMRAIPELPLTSAGDWLRPKSRSLQADSASPKPPLGKATGLGQRDARRASSTGARPTPCRNGPARAGTTFATSTRKQHPAFW